MITIKNESQIEKMRESASILVEIMKGLKNEIKPGVKTKLFEERASKLVKQRGLECSFKGVHDYPACTCTSINDEIVHVPPSERKLKKGDLFSLDMGVEFDNYHSDMAFTVGVGKVSSEKQKLMRVTREALMKGIEQVSPNNTLGDIGHAIQSYVGNEGYNVVEQLCGHGIGQEVHQDPQVLNKGEAGKGLQLEEGMVICLEPMVTLGSGEIKRTDDGHGFKT
ncbi:MAG: type I methionyl aminopeptidase, partial [Candidatus Paceibacterota bacterium]